MTPALLGLVLQGGCQLFGGHAPSGTPAGGDAASTPLAADTAPTTGLSLDAAKPSAGQAPALQVDAAVTPVALQTPAPVPAPTDGTAAPGRIEPVPVGGKPETHQRPAPTATGELLRLAPGESPIERLTAVTLKLDAVEADRKTLQGRVQTLSTALEEREKALHQATREVQDSADEIQRTRTAAQTLKQDLDEVRAALSRRDKDEIETLKAINKLLERYAEDKKSPSAGTEDRMPWRPK